LEKPGLQLVGLDRELVAVEIHADQVDGLRSDDLPRQAGHREAPFLKGPLTVGLHDPRVQDHAGVLAVVVYEEPLLHADLGGRQADAQCLVHGAEHVLGQPNQRAVHIGHVGSRRAEDGVANDPDLVGGHGDEATVATVDAQKDQHYWSDRPEAASRPGEVSLLLPDVDLTLATDRGVFSADRVDRGTRYLLLEGPPPPSGPIALMDLGCGYGPIACALATRNPEATVWAVDVNERARDLCRSNAANAGLDGVRVVAPDEVPDDLSLAGLWSNPPIRIGKEALHELLNRWLGRLAPEGTAHLVVQRHLGADSLARWLDGVGWTTTRRGSRKGFRLLDVARVEPDVRNPT